MDYGFLTNMLGLELRKTQKLAERKFEWTFDNNLLVGQLTVLVLIKYNPGHTQSAIAQAAGLDRSSLVPILKQFEKRGLITRSKAPGDGRSNMVKITELGDEAITEFMPHVVQLEASVSRQFGAKKTAQLVQLLQEFQALLVK